MRPDLHSCDRQTMVEYVEHLEARLRTVEERNARRVRARRSDPASSSRGNDANLPRRGTQKAAALEAIGRAGPPGLTADEVQQMTGIDGIWKRVSDLADDGLIEPTGQERRSRKGVDVPAYRLAGTNVGDGDEPTTLW